MQLSTARLCLDCEEIHDAQVCPVCASETFTFLSRWIPAPEPSKRRPAPISEDVQAYRQLIDPDHASESRRGRLLKQGFIGLTAVGALGWLWRNSRPQVSKDRDDAAG